MKWLYVLAFVCIAFQVRNRANKHFPSSRPQPMVIGNSQSTKQPMPMDPQDSSRAIEYYYCSKCQHKWINSRNALANATSHVRGILTKRTSGQNSCKGAVIKAHAFKPSNTRIGGTSRNWQLSVDDTNESHSDNIDDSTEQQPFEGAYQDIQEFPPSPNALPSGRIDPQELQGDNTSQQQQHVHKSRAWTVGDLSSIFEHCRRGLPNKDHASSSAASPLQHTFDELVNCGPHAHKYSDYTTFWTKDDVTNSINCPANITSFGVDRDQDLQDFQTNMGASSAEQRFMHFCHSENVTYTTTRKLYTFIQEEKINHEDFTHQDYQTLHNKMKNHIPDEYKFQMVKLTVGKMYGCEVPVTDSNNEQVEVPVRNLWKILCLLFADPRYRGYLDLHPEPVFVEGPNGLERLYNGFASCEHPP